MKTKRTSTAVQRWGKCALTLLLACAMLAGLALSAAARDSYQGEVVDPAIPKPVVTVQGNLVVDKPGGKPTGFYELALCVRSGRTITDPAGVTGVTPGSVIDEAAFEAYLAANPTVAEDPGAVFDIHYYPFTSVGGAVNINTDVLTAVNWAIQNVTYDEYDAVQGLYKDEAAAAIPAPGSYPRGIDTDPDVQGYDPAVVSRADAFPNITTANVLLMDSNPSVAIDVEADPRMFEATGQVDYYDAANSTALMTLTASAPDNRPITLAESTPLVVARFSYDLKRFSSVKVNDVDWAGDVRNAATGDSGDVGLWLGWDKTTAITAGTNATLAQKTPLTWLGESDTVALYDFSQSDFMAARTRVNQTAWVHMVDDGAAVTARDTYFYYYLGSEDNQNDGQETLQVVVGGAPTAVPGITIPKTSGEKVLTEGTQENPVPAPAPSPAPTQAGYTYFRNLLRLKDQTMVLELVNAETFKKPSGGGGGNMILFYDWDDRLIGSLAVDKGDVRAEVEAYIEENLVHPDLRPDSAFMKNAAGTGTDLSKVVSLQRDYTYRGKYAYTVGGDDAALGVSDGKEYPLTNKLDYVFTKRVNTTLTQVDAATGDTVRYVHPYSLDDAVNLDPTVTDAALYPYVYGWAVVEDATATNGMVGATGTKGDWKTMHDADKIEDTWTTLGTGELGDIKRTVLTNPTLSTVGTVDPAAVRTAPAFLNTADPTWTDGTRADANDYAYQLSGENSYLRFADFSDITAELARYGGKDTLIVKAVYEEGESLLNGNNYTAITEPAYTKWNNVAASAGGSYRVQMTLERSYTMAGQLRGTTRIRMPVVQQDTTIDYKWLEDADKGVNHDLTNTSYDTSTTKEETLYTQVDADNGEEITFSLALSPRQNRVDYVLVEKFNSNFVVGTQRSGNNNAQKNNPDMFIPDNYNYLAGTDSDILDDLYDPDFSTKEGSHGFVLYGTLGHFLEQATKCNNGVITRTAYNSSVTYSTAIDANLRMNLGGAQPDFMSNTTLRDAFIAAATACAAHKGDPAYDCWDPNLDCAKLTYHQAQWFLLDYQSNPLADILDVATADAQTLPFCHYHVHCSGGHVPVPPASWKDLIDKVQEYNNAAPGSDDQKNADADLGALDLATLDSMTNLRANATGGKFTDLNTFLTALKKSDVDLRTAGVSVNWPNLQYAIINASAGGTDALMRTEAEESYWWYAGANTAPRISDFDALLKAGEEANTAATLKDGDATFLPKSALKAATFPETAKNYLTSVSVTKGQRNAWITLTDNLVPGHSEIDYDPDGTPNSGDEYTDYTDERFTDIEDFVEKVFSAFDGIYRSGVPPPDGDKDAWWEELQTRLLPDGDNLGVHNGDTSTKFWWKSGNAPFKVNNFTTLIECVRRLNASDTTTDEYATAQTAWDRLSVADIEGVAISQGLRWRHPSPAVGEELHPQLGTALGADDATQKAAILAQLKAAVASYDTAMASNPTMILNWAQIQYLLLNPGALPDASTVNTQSYYYWWKNGGTGTAVDIAGAGGNMPMKISRLMEALVREKTFAEPNAMDQVNSGDAFDLLRIVKADPTGDSTVYTKVDLANNTVTKSGVTDQPEDRGVKYTSTAALLADIQGLLDKLKADQGITDNYTIPSGVDWPTIQYWVLKGIQLTPSNPDYATLGTAYWWYTKDVWEAPPAVKPEPTKNLVTYLQDYCGNSNATVLKNKITMASMNNTFKVRAKSAGTKWTAATQAQAKVIAVELAKAAKTSYYKDWDGSGTNTLKLTWAQIQVYFATSVANAATVTKKGELLTPEAALDRIVNTWGWTQVSSGGAKAWIPDEVDMSILPGGASLDSLEMDEAAATDNVERIDLPEPDVPLTQAPAEDPAAIQARIEELERELAQLRQRLAAAQAAEAAGSLPQSAAPTAPSSEGALGNTSQARPSPGGSIKDPEPEDAPTPDEPSSEDVGADVSVGPPDTDTSTPENTPHAEREETPQGEDARAVVTVSKARSAVGTAVPGGSQDTNTSGREDVGAAVPSGPQDTNTSDSEHVGTVLPDGPRPTTSVLSAADGEAARGVVTVGSLPQSAAPTAPSSEGALGNTSQARPSPEPPSDEGGAPEGGGGREPQAERAPSLDSPPGLSSGRLSTRRACSATSTGPGVAALHRLTALTPADWRRVRWLM